jgi:hypothetical protein
VEVTCLIIKDGYDRYKFIHLSVLEYFTACFISQLPEEKIITFFKQLNEHKSQKNNEYNKWSVVLGFLSEIKKNLYIEFFLYPSILRLHEAGAPLDKQEILNLFDDKDGNKVIASYNFSGKLIGITLPKGKLSGLPENIEELLHDVLIKYFQKLDLKQIKSGRKKHYPDNTTQEVNLSNVLDEYSHDTWDNFIKYFNKNFMSVINEEYVNCEAQMKINEQKLAIDILSP